jgi:membrane-associated phospholipid phosphatase
MTDTRRPAAGPAAARGIVCTALAVTLAGAMTCGMAEAEAQESANRTPTCEACGLRASLVEDIHEEFTAPFHLDPERRTIAMRNALIVVGAMALLDEPVADFFQDRRNSSSERIANAFEPFGRQYAAAVLLGYGLAGTLNGNARARATALNGTISSVIAGGLVVPAFKAITGRSRPRAGQGAHDFDPLSGKASFPSGHTAEAFALATSIALNSDRPWVKGLCYGTATMVGYARIEHDGHWLSDTVAGAFIGVAVAKSVHDLDRRRRGLEVGASPIGDGVSLSLSKNF